MLYEIFVPAPGASGNELQTQLGMAQSYSYPDEVRIYVGPGVHILSQRFCFHCSLKLIGMGETPVIQISNSVLSQNATNYPNGLQDAFIFVSGLDTMHLNAKFENLKFTCESPAAVFQESFVLKVENGNEVEFKNVESNIKNGALTNIDLRDCLNIRVEGCTLINNNYVTGTTVIGGCLWIRGEISSALIKGNFFTKNGNDEALAIWFPKKVGTANVLTKRMNVDICQNIFIFAKLMNDATQVYNPCDVLIKFYNEDSVRMAVNWTNLNFHDNTIQLHGFCGTLANVRG